MRRCHVESLVVLMMALWGGWATRLPAANAKAAPASPADDQCREVMCLDGDGPLELDPTHMTLRHFRIVYPQRETTVTGDLAEGEMPKPNSKDMHWVLTGHVEVTMPQGHLTAERATMQVVDNRISSMTAEGSPAVFDRGSDATPPVGTTASVAQALAHAHGHARQIIYDLDRGQLEFSGDSYLSNGCYEFTSEHVTYDIANQRVQADPRDGDSVHLKFTRDRSGGNNCPGGSVGGGNKP